MDSQRAESGTGIEGQRLCTQTASNKQHVTKSKGDMRALTCGGSPGNQQGGLLVGLCSRLHWRLYSKLSQRPP